MLHKQHELMSWCVRPKQCAFREKKNIEQIDKPTKCVNINSPFLTTFRYQNYATVIFPNSQADYFCFKEKSKSE